MSDSGNNEPYSIPESRRSGQNYICNICGKKLTRSAHLRRHRLVHSTENVDIFQCQLCDKRFSRKDVYQRHKRGVHGSTSSQTGRKKSCRRCIQYKLKCSRDEPCDSCSNRGGQCIFDLRGKVAQGPPIDDRVTTQPPDSMNGQANLAAISSGQTPPSSATIERSISPGTIGADGHSGDRNFAVRGGIATPFQRPEMESGSMETSYKVSIPELQLHELVSDNSSQIALLNTDYQHPTAAWEAVEISTMMRPAVYATSSTKQLPYEFDQGTMGGFEPADDDNSNQAPNLDGFDWNNFRASRMDWLGCETEYSDHQSLPTERPPSRQCQRKDTSETNLQKVSNPHDPLFPAVIELPHRSPSLLGLPGLRDPEAQSTWPGILDRGGNETWPFDYTSNKGFRKISLPPLREVLEQTVGERPAIEKSTLMDLIKILSAPYIPSLNDSPVLEALPAVAFLSQFVNIFFAEFHAVLPVIHVSTWQIVKCPTALVAAMACIGATYSTAEGREEVAALLAEITQRALFWMGQADSTAYRNPAYITASFFHQMYSLGTGNRRLYEIADASRGLLLTSLRGLGTLSPDSEREDLLASDLTSLRDVDTTRLEALWLRWRDKEMEKRIAWSVFEYDCTLCTLTNKRAVFSITELPHMLPCSESLWEAHSAQSWVSMISFTSSLATGIPFYPLLRDTIGCKANLEMVPAWSKRICAQAVGRLFWDLREIEDVSSIKFVGLPALSNAQKETKATLLRSLMFLHDSLLKPTCASDIVNLNIGCSVTYYCSLSNGHQVMDLVVYIFRNSGRESIPAIKSELKRAKDHLSFIFMRNPVEARRLVCHASSIAAIARECTIYTPCETMRVFMGFAYLLAFTKIFPFEQQGMNVMDASTSVSVLLDEIPWARSPAASRSVERWVQYGGSASLSSVGNICDPNNLALLKNAALKALCDLRVWGLAEKFQKTIRNFK